ncbi:GTP cyclohydrolase [Companilactobacillus heilongjiangensis]|uniref:GTP cyclohydrolase 1 n=1 Tax=Companilactobacillus heilongjiangensis TaxID=1074467 RepID=A0A0K2LDJ4_9LACO|nr:GTP cyclohydrolase I FolE [Companilactobacillus heilongjiangensis]ALB29372.1 GTP cyclohydrolase [Companilactobacillus heilongjiangensis]
MSVNRTTNIEESVRNIIKLTGDNPEREGLLETPKRVARMYQEILSSQGKKKFEEYKIFTANTTNNSQMILINDIPFYSMCEHHMLPFFGTAHVAYIPNNGKIIGLSKIPRLVDFVSRKLNVQENITRDVALILDEILNPKGVAVVLDARHMCVEMRGIKKGNCVTRTSFYSGKFDKYPQMRYEFLQNLNNK